MSWRIGIDVGGTFVDLVAWSSSGDSRVAKILATSQGPAEAVLTGLRRLLAEVGAAPADIESVVHGTTLVVNALIERKGASTGLLVSAGFEDVLAIGREDRYDMSDLFLRKPSPLVPRSRTLGVGGRIDAQGIEVAELDEAGVHKAAEQMEVRGVETIAVSLLFSFLNSRHEMAAARILSRRFGRPVCVSSEVAPAVGEYERTTTTAANAYVTPAMSSYLTSLAAGLEDLELSGRLSLMMSSGGVCSCEEATRYPIRLLESGPAGGAVAAGLSSGVANAPGTSIAFDVGGTTAKACILRNGVPDLDHRIETAHERRLMAGSGLPILIPSVRLIEIGAGGGSIARQDRVGRLLVGPESAGAAPGPACYGFGGRDPTVTDAALVLGYLSEDYFLGGAMRLDRKLAAGALRGELGTLGSPEQVASAIVDVANEEMAEAIRLHCMEAGVSVQLCTLVAYGGAGPMHAYGVAKKLGLRSVVIPAQAGVASAVGLLLAPLACDVTEVCVAVLGQNLSEAKVGALSSVLEELGRTASERVIDKGVAPSDIALYRMAELRYLGQDETILVRGSSGVVDREWVADLAHRFTDEYQLRRGGTIPGVAVELVAFRVRAEGRRHSWSKPSEHVRTGAGCASRHVRPVYFPDRGGFVDCQVVRRHDVLDDWVVSGPAIIEEPESTTVVGPDATASVSDGQLVLAIG